MKENAEETSHEGQVKSDDLYPTPSNTRNLVFEWADGRQLFLNYAYLISCELAKENDRLTLTFTNCTISIEGVKLQTLFAQLQSHILRVIAEDNVRYRSLESDSPKVYSIVLL